MTVDLILFMMAIGIGTTFLVVFGIVFDITNDRVKR